MSLWTRYFRFAVDNHDRDGLILAGIFLRKSPRRLSLSRIIYDPRNTEWTVTLR